MLGAGANAQDAFGFTQGVRLLLPFGVAWLSFWSLGHIRLYKMKALSDALVHAVAYINCLPDPTEAHVDDDVHMLEDMAAYLANSTEDERDALAAAAQRAYEQEQGGGKRTDYLQVYSIWMECMFGDGWEGNQRV